MLVGFDELNARRLRDWLRREGGFRVLNPNRGEDVGAALASGRADVALIADDALAWGEGWGRLLRARGGTPVVVGMLDHRPERAAEALRAGACAVVPLISTSPAGRSGVLTLGASGLLGSPLLPAKAAEPIELLTPRLREEARLIAAGLSLTEIAERLYLAKDTIKKYRRRIYKRLDVETPQQLARAFGQERALRRPETLTAPRPLGCRRLASPQRNWSRPSQLHMAAALGGARRCWAS